MAVRKTTKKSPTKKAVPLRSFQLSKNTHPFFVFRITHQTFYWVILCALVLALGIWVIMINVQLQKLYDQVDMLNHDASVQQTTKR